MTVTCGGCQLAYGGTCQKCPDGCKVYDNPGQGVGIGGGCNCGAGAVFMRRSNTRLVCPADQTPIAREYDGTGTSSGDVCKCTQYTIGLPNGGKVCTACTGLGQRKGDNGVCTCTAGAFSNDAGTACLCPNNAQGQAQAIDQSGTCQPCLGFATITDVARANA